METFLVRKAFVVTALVGLSFGGATSIARAAAINCNGGAQKALLTTIGNSNFSTASTAFALIPGATIPITLSGAASDTYTLTFSGEASATGGGTWDVEAQRSVDGGSFSDMPPVGIINFHSGNKAAANSMSWCNRISASTSVAFRVLWRKLGGGTAVIGGYTMQILRSE